MKDTAILNLFRIRGASSEFDDRPNYEYPVEKIEISYKHCFINKKRKLFKAAKEYGLFIKKYPYITIITDKNTCDGIIKVLDGISIDVCNKKYHN